jgi:hypothetical protein
MSESTLASTPKQAFRQDHPAEPQVIYTELRKRRGIDREIYGGT